MTATPPSTPTAREHALAELRTLYADLAREIAELAPVCDLSGRCCNFARYGHDLFVTALELDELVRAHGPPPPATAPGRCAYQAEVACTARDGRPLGCRVFFCDPRYEAAMPELAQRYHVRLKAIHERWGIPYEYGEFLRALERRRA